MQDTYENILNFGHILNFWLTKHDTDDTKFKYGAKKMLDRVVKIQEKYKILIEDIDIDNCAVDKDRVMIKDEKGGCRFTIEGQKKRNKEVRNLFETGTAELETYAVNEYPDDLKEVEEVLTKFMPLRTLTVVENESAG